jgi:hypothetical protein
MKNKEQNIKLGSEMKLMQFSPGLEGVRIRIFVNMQDIFQERFLYQDLVR